MPTVRGGALSKPESTQAPGLRLRPTFRFCILRNLSSCILRSLARSLRAMSLDVTGLKPLMLQRIAKDKDEH